VRITKIPTGQEHSCGRWREGEMFTREYVGEEDRITEEKIRKEIKKEWEY
jgi:hypothetical protein